MSVGIGGLNYIALGIGFSLGTQVCIVGSDHCAGPNPSDRHPP